MFFYNSDKDISEFVIQKSEVMGLKWFEKKDLEKILKNKKEPFVYNLDKIFKSSFTTE